MKDVFAHKNSLLNSMTYRVGNCVVDPGDTIDYIGVTHVLLTHAHFDHIYGLNELLRHSPNAKVFTNTIGEKMLLDARKNMSFYHETPYVFDFPEAINIIEDGDEIIIDGDLVAKGVFTPGHNPSCVTWIVGDAVFSGDAYIPGVKTVTNLPGGNKSQVENSLQIIKNLLQGRKLYPGHDV